MMALAKGLWVKTPVGGMARYENDEYYRVSNATQGNPWFICTLWMARWYIARANSLEELTKGLDLLLWVTKHSPPSGVLGEQLDPYTGEPVSVSPLIWSHAEFVIAVYEYLDKHRRISSSTET
jgi:GH15 family glucan-1,4-alpha-glucosidase